MARNEHSEVPGAESLPADALADDVKLLLDQLANQITDADQRHSDSLQHMQVRLAALSDRAAAAKPDLPDNSVEAFGRVETAMAALADRLADAETHAAHPEPTADAAGTDLPDEVRAELRRAIAEGHREVRATPSVAHVAQAGSEGTIAPAIERAWLEDRFADIADRVEKSMERLDRHNSFEAIGARFDQLEQRFAVALDASPAQGGPDAGALQGIEKQITGLFSELDRAQTQLGRLDTIESCLTELRQDPSDERMAHLIRALSPTDAQLTAVAMAAAECVAERIREGMPAGAASSGDPAPATDPRLGELAVLLQEFISENRTGDALTAEALDTMQQAMQHLIDRVEAIEAAQITGHDELMRAAKAMPAHRGDGRHEPLDFGFREQDLVPSTIGTHELPRLAVVGPTAMPAPIASAPDDPRHAHAELDYDDGARRLAAALDDLTDAPPPVPAHTAPPQAEPPTSGPPHRQAFIAMARRAAEKAARETSPQTAPAATGPLGAALGWARNLTDRRDTGEATGAARSSRILLVASFAAFLLAGFWMLAGTELRSMIPGLGSKQPVSPIQSPAQAPGTRETGAADETMGRQAPLGDTPGRLTPAPRNQGFPGLGRVADGGIGITIDDGQRTTDPAAMMKAREQVQLASLSTKAGQDRPPQEPTPRSGPVEMPSAMIGPLSLRHAAANGDPAAQFEVASRFAEAKGVPQDFAQAATWYQRAATQGLANAQYRLGALYERGLGVAADPARARVWYGRAAEQGNVRAMHNLAVFSAGRPGSSPDYPSAVQWFTEAANRGLADSQYNLGILYESGLGVPASMVEAYKWYALAARSGDKDATRRRDALRQKLDPASVAAADTLVIKWRAKPIEASANDLRAAGLGTR